MNILKVPFLPGIGFDSALTDISDVLLNYKPSEISNEPWPTGARKPQVEFYIAYGADAIFLKYKVKEKYFKAEYTRVNDLVYKESCVEFFISFDNDDTYYNFEFNALGTPYVAYGRPGERQLLDASLISDIKISAQQTTNFADALPYSWELTLAIPYRLFYKHSIKTLKGMICRANFYKCGDELPEPHYLCWNNIIADKPNFHLPQYFGKLIFE